MPDEGDGNGVQLQLHMAIDALYAQIAGASLTDWQAALGFGSGTTGVDLWNAASGGTAITPAQFDQSIPAGNYDGTVWASESDDGDTFDQNSQTVQSLPTDQGVESARIDLFAVDDKITADEKKDLTSAVQQDWKLINLPYPFLNTPDTPSDSSAADFTSGIKVITNNVGDLALQIRIKAGPGFNDAAQYHGFYDVVQGDRRDTDSAQAAVAWTGGENNTPMIADDITNASAQGGGRTKGATWTPVRLADGTPSVKWTINIPKDATHFKVMLYYTGCSQLPRPRLLRTNRPPTAQFMGMVTASADADRNLTGTL